jgi:hypothetical protein
MFMHDAPSRARRIGGTVAAAVLIAFGVAAAYQGLSGSALVHDKLAQEAIVGTPTMSPSAITEEISRSGVAGIDVPTCAVAGRTIDDGAGARCFAEYMRVDALMATRGKTYAQMPRFATKDGRGTNIEARALRYPNGRPMDNPARNVWVTETALSNALNTSYMAQQVSLFGIAVGAAFLLVGLLLATFSLAGVKLPVRGTVRARQPEGAMS